MENDMTKEPQAPQEPPQPTSATDLAEAIFVLIQKKAGELPLASIIGVLELVKVDIIFDMKVEVKGR